MKPVSSGLSSVSPEDYKRGVRGYTSQMHSCRCGADTNTKWFNSNLQREVIACSQECANKASERKKS